MSNVMTISKRTASGLEEVLRTLLLDSENKVPSERLRIVGAIADGAIIEEGSNTNGEWVRLANGTQWCYKNISLIGYEIPSGFTTYGLVYYPAVFISAPTISIVYTGNTPQSVRATCTDPVKSGASVQLYNTSTASVVPTFGGIALLTIGRWKA